MHCRFCVKIDSICKARKYEKVKTNTSRSQCKIGYGNISVQKKNGGSTKTRHIQKIAAHNMKNRKTSELSADHGRLPYRIVWIIPTELLRESMAFMRRCIIAVDLFGPTPKVLSTPRRQASEKLDVPAEVRPTQNTEERFFRLLLRRVSSFFFARIRDRSENTGDTFFYFFFL